MEEVLSELQRLRASPETIRLDHGALLIARAEYPHLDHARYLAELDRLSARVRAALPPGGEPGPVVAAVNRVLFDEEGYRGNEEDYYDPRNSYLNDVMDRRLGIPITLCVVYLEIARRIAFPLAGVSFPGHFLIRHRTSQRLFYIDPFRRGEIVLPGELPDRLAALFGKEAAEELLRRPEEGHPARFTADAAPQEILVRMLTNLREIHLRRRDLVRARHVVAMLLALGLEPGAIQESIAAIRKIEAALN